VASGLHNCSVGQDDSFTIGRPEHDSRHTVHSLNPARPGPTRPDPTGHEQPFFFFLSFFLSFFLVVEQQAAVQHTATCRSITAGTIRASGGRDCGNPCKSQRSWRRGLNLDLPNMKATHITTFGQSPAAFSCFECAEPYLDATYPPASIPFNQ